MGTVYVWESHFNITDAAMLQVQFTNTGVCHGFALWIDWVLDAESGILVSTGPGTKP